MKLQDMLMGEESDTSIPILACVQPKNVNLDVGVFIRDWSKGGEMKGGWIWSVHTVCMCGNITQNATNVYT